MGCRISPVLYAIVQAIAFLFVLIGTPVKMMSAKPTQVDNQSCITLWGYKEFCRERAYTFKNDELWEACPRRRDRFRAAEAFAIISIFVFGAAAVCGVIRVFCCSGLRWACLVLNIIGIVTACITWAVVAEAFHREENEECQRMKWSFNLSVGFALFVVAWCLDIVNIVVLMLPC